MSAKVAQLEDELGVRLFERTTRVVRLTDAGTRYRELAAPAVEALTEAKNALSELHAAPTGHLRVTAPMELGQHVMGPVLATYLARYPDVHVTVDLTARHVNLVEEGVDVAIRAGELEDSSLLARTLGPPHGFVVCASRSYLARHGTPHHPSDLSRHRCLLMHDRQEPAAWRFGEGRRRWVVRVECVASVNSFTVLRELAVAGVGIAGLPRFAAAPALADGSLRAVLTSYGVEQAFHALYPSSRHLSPRVRTFLDVLQQELGRILGHDDKKRRGRPARADLPR